MRRLLLAAGLSLALLATGCRTNEAPDGAPVSQPGVDVPGERVIAIQREPVPIAKQMEGQTGIVQVVVTDQGFEPSVLTSAIGGMVKVHLRNAGTKEHNFIVPRFGIVTSNLAPGGENYIEFPASQKGEWPFFSDAIGREETGLKGILKVE